MAVPSEFLEMWICECLLEHSTTALQGTCTSMLLLLLSETVSYVFYTVTFNPFNMSLLNKSI